MPVPKKDRQHVIKHQLTSPAPSSQHEPLTNNSLSSANKHQKHHPAKPKAVSSDRNVNLIMPVERNTVSISIFGIPIKALVDTGASISCLSAHLLPKLGLNPNELDPSNIRDAVAVGGERHASLGAITLPVSFNGPIIPHRFHVFKSFHQPLILGLDFLQANDGIFNTENNTLYVRDSESTTYAIDTNTGCARVSRYTILPKHSVTSLQVYVSNVPKNSCVLLEPISKLPSLKLAGAKSIVDTKNNKAFIQVMNPTNKTIRLKATTVIASATIVDPNTVFAMETSSDRKVSAENTVQEPININLDHADLQEDQKQLLLTFLNKHRSIFATNLQELGQAKTQPHRIETGDAFPIRQRFYRQSPQTNAEMNRQLQEMLDSDMIEESDSMWQSPVVMVKKKNGQLRFAVDYRKLNAVTKQFTFPLPRLEDVFDTIGTTQAKFFSTLDLASGFWQIPMDEETKHKSAFVTPTGVYQWKRMPFGLVNAPASFQALMTHVLRGLNWKTCLVYVDDILVFSNSFTDHLKHLDEIFSRLQSAGLTLKPSKCYFALPEVKYLGHILTKDGIKVDLSKTDAVQSFPTPKNQKELRSFLGLCNYYRRFVKGYSKITSPLSSLLSKDKEFTWTQECQNAFEKLKTLLTTPPVLAYPDHTRPFSLTTDASGTAIGYILGQRDKNGKDRVIAYGGRSLNKHERKYPISEREGLAIIEGIKTFHVYLAGRPFKIFTDHAALKWLQNVKQSTGRLARWAVLLQGYSYEILFKAGKKNEVADALSRRPYPDTAVPMEDPEDIIPSPDVQCFTPVKEEKSMQATFFYADHQHPFRKTIETETICPVDITSIGDLQKGCPDFKDLYNYFVDRDLPEDKKCRDRLLSESNFYVFLDGVLYHYYQPRSKRARHPNNHIKQLAVPRCLREDVIRSYHDSLAGGAHFGFERTYRAIQLKYYWPAMYQNIADYVRSCRECQLSKRPTHHAPAPLTPMPIEDRFSRIHMDILGPITKTTEGHKYILLVVDSFSKWPEAFPLRTQDSTEIAKVLFKEIFCRYGAPYTIVTDRGQNFMSKLVTAVCQIFQVTRHFTSSYHPQTNATCERMNSTIAQCLRTYVNQSQTNWHDILPGILMAIRMSPSTQSSDLAPYQILFGKEMYLPFDTSLIPKDGMNQDAKTHVTNLMKHLKLVREIATQNIQHARQKQKEQYDKTSKEPNFSVGQSVLLHKPHVPKGLSPKLHNPWDGPYYITAECPNNTYSLRKCSNTKAVKSRIHANRLKHFENPDFRKVLDPPPLTDPIDDSHLPPEQRNSQPIENEEQERAQPPVQPHNEPHHDDAQATKAQPTTPNMAIPQTNDQHVPPIPQTQQTLQNTPERQVDADQPTNDSYGYVEKLMQYKLVNGKKYFLVKWQGSGVKTWEPEENINDELIWQYHITRTQTGRARKRRRRTRSCFY